jgi:RND superfamily putative drug exporter
LRAAAALAWVAVRFRWLVVPAWAAAAVAATLWLPGLSEARGSSLSGLVPEDAEAIATGIRTVRLFDVPLTAHSAVVQRNPKGLSDDAHERIVARAIGIAEGRDPRFREVAFALPVVNTLRLFPASREDGTTAITYLFFHESTTVARQDRLAREFAEFVVDDPGDSLVGVTGAAPARLQEWRAIQRSLLWVELATVGVVALILGLYFRGLGAPLAALLTSGVAYLVSTRVVAWVGTQSDVSVPSDVEPIMVVLLLGIVTDYAVFFLAGLRRRLAAGDPRVEAALHATADVAPIVLTAGLIVAAGTAALLAGTLDFFRAFGPGLALTVLVSLAVAVTLLPALMAIFGARLFWPGSARPERAATEPLVGGAVARLVSWRPVALVVSAVCVAVLALACRGLLEINLGFTLISGLPKDAAAQRAADAAAQGFVPGILAPTVVLVEEPGIRGRKRELERLQKGMGRQPGVAAVIGPGDEVASLIPGAVVAEKAEAVRFLVVLNVEPYGGEAIDLVSAFRDRMPRLLERAGLADARFGLAGDTALAEETVETLVGDIGRITLAAVLVNFVLLALFLRAVVAPLYLIAASGLALAASLGLTTYVFQDLLGHGDLTFYVPFAVAVLLLSLGSDYNVFVVGRIWQEARHRPLREAIVVAAPRASRAVAVAGIALAASFATLAIVPLRPFRELAFAMGVGVLLDAFVVRALLVPALISLFGPVGWWPGRPARVRVAQE